MTSLLTADTVRQDDGTLRRELPDGSVLAFDDTGRTRTYKLQVGDEKPKRLTSVTTILGVLEKRALYAWYEKHGADGTLEAIRRDLLDPRDPAVDPIRVVRDNGLGADAAKAKAAKRGLSVHDALEVYCRTSAMPPVGELDPEHRAYYQGLARALLTLSPEPLVVEQITCSAVHGYSGRFDLIATIDGRRTMLDLKTSNRVHGWPEGHLQLQAYELAEVECGGDPCERHIVLGIGPDGTFAADDCQADRDQWLSVLSTFRALSEVRRRVDGLVRAAKKAAA